MQYVACEIEEEVKKKFYSIWMKKYAKWMLVKTLKWLSIRLIWALKNGHSLDSSGQILTGSKLMA